MDSIRVDFRNTADSIQTRYRNALSKIHAHINKLNNSIDSLQRLNLPTGKYAKRLDSLNQVRQTTASKFTSTLDALKAKTTRKLNSLDLPPEYKESLQQLTKSVND